MWIAPDTTEWQLDNPILGWFTPPAVSGLGAAPITITTDPNPRGGENVRHIQPEARFITWPLHVFGPTHMVFLERWRALAQAFTQTRRLGAGTLRLMRPDGSARDIRAYYQAGFNNEPDRNWIDDTVALTLLCEDPYWRDVQALTVEREHVVSTTSFLSPYPTVGTSNVLGATTVVNPSNVEAWPDWTITGPATSITATNNTTGESFVLTPSPALTAGQVATITTDPPTVRGPAGAIWTGLLNWPSAVLWGLVPGPNAVTFSVAGSAAGTKIALSFRPRHETA
jgi:hypothetical protein